MPELTVVLDAGHGGSDSGATYKGRLEKDDTLRLVKAVGAILENNGINVVYTRENDIYETPFKKATEGNNSGADFFISIHRNSSETPNQYSGVETLVYNNDGIRAVMAENINNELAKAGYRNLGVDERPNLVVLRRTQMPAALVEVGFINNDEDNRIFDENFPQIAQGIANGIIKTLYSQNVAYSELDDSFIPESILDADYTTERISTPDHRSDDMMRNDYDNNNNMTTPDYNTGNNAMPNPNAGDNNQYIPNFSNDGDDDNDMDDYNYPNYYQNNLSRNNNSNTDNTRNNNNNNNSIDNIANNSMNNELMREAAEPLYRVQVGAYQNRDNAERMLNSLLIEGFPAFIIYDNGFYKVQVGAFRNLLNAIKMERRLRRFRYNTYIAYY